MFKLTLHSLLKENLKKPSKLSESLFLFRVFAVEFALALAKMHAPEKTSTNQSVFVL